MPVERVDNHVELRFVQQLVDDGYDAGPVLLGRTVAEGEGAVYEVVLYVDYDESRHRLENLPVTYAQGNLPRDVP